ncbi:MAG: hypothetical protein ABII18_04765 [bacterium]
MTERRKLWPTKHPPLCRKKVRFFKEIKKNNHDKFKKAERPTLVMPPYLQAFFNAKQNYICTSAKSIKNKPGLSKIEVK